VSMSMNQRLRQSFAIWTAIAFVGCGGGPAPLSTAPGLATRSRGASQEFVDIVAAPDRSEDDRRLDSARHPAELLTFLGVHSGMRVAELGAGTGYMAELLARSVGSAGAVYGQNSRWILERYAERPWTERLNKPVMKNVVRIDRRFDDPFPPDVRDLDLVLCVLFYHDLVWMEVDRAKMLRSVHTALRRGGRLTVIDHSGRPGTGTAEVRALHRIDEAVVRAEVQRAGFRLRAEGTLLRNRADTRDWNAAPMAAGDLRGTSDRFVLMYEKQ
jgi:predicted methyltransferase